MGGTSTWIVALALANAFHCDAARKTYRKLIRTDQAFNWERGKFEEKGNGESVSSHLEETKAALSSTGLQHGRSIFNPEKDENVFDEPNQKTALEILQETKVKIPSIMDDSKQELIMRASTSQLDSSKSVAKVEQLSVVAQPVIKFPPRPRRSTKIISKNYQAWQKQSSLKEDSSSKCFEKCIIS